jgi:hypothetical protein
MNTNTLKWLTIIVLGLYVYQTYQERKGAVKMGAATVNPKTVFSSVLPWLNLNPVAEQFVRAAGNKFMHGWDSVPKDTIDAEYWRVA